MGEMTTRKFWQNAFERAVKTGAQTILAVLVVGDGILNAFQIDYLQAGGVGLGGIVLSLLTSIASSAIGDHEDPSLVSRNNPPTITRRDPRE